MKLALMMMMLMTMMIVVPDSGKHDDGDNDDGGLQAHSHHDKFPPWWGFVRDDYGGNLSVTKSHH